MADTSDASETAEISTESAAAATAATGDIDSSLMSSASSVSSSMHAKGASNDFSFMADAFAAPIGSASSLPSVTENGHSQQAPSSSSSSSEPTSKPLDLLSAFGDFSAAPAPAAEVEAAAESSNRATKPHHGRVPSLPSLMDAPFGVATGMVRAVDHSSTNEPFVTSNNTNGMLSNGINGDVEVLPVIKVTEGDNGSPRNNQSGTAIGDVETKGSNDAPLTAASISTSEQKQAAETIEAVNAIPLPSVYVAARIRPFNQREKASETVPHVEAHDDTVVCLRIPAGGIPSTAGRRGSVFASTSAAGGMGTSDTARWATLDRVWWSHDGFTTDNDNKQMVATADASPPFISQTDIWHEVGERIALRLLAGSTVGMIACGSVGSGKSFTPIGYGAEPGLLPRLIHELKARVHSIRFSLSVVEVYMEQVLDLQHDRKSVKVMEGELRGDIKHDFDHWKEAEDLMERAMTNRMSAATQMNANSARGHTVSTIELKWSDNGVNQRSRLILVDLASSESTAGLTGDVMKEAVAINTSVTALGSCINAYVNGTKPPFRDSSLTKTLQSCLQGNGICLVFAALSPSIASLDESQTTLRWLWALKKLPCGMTPPPVLRVAPVTTSVAAAAIPAPSAADTTATAATITSDDTAATATNTNHDISTTSADTPATEAPETAPVSVAAEPKVSKISVPGKTAAAKGAAKTPAVGKTSTTAAAKSAPKAGARALPKKASNAAETTSTTALSGTLGTPAAAASKPKASRPQSAKAVAATKPKLAASSSSSAVVAAKKPKAETKATPTDNKTTAAKPKLERAASAKPKAATTTVGKEGKTEKAKVGRPQTAGATRASGGTATGATAAAKPKAEPKKSVATNVVRAASTHVASATPSSIVAIHIGSVTDSESKDNVPIRSADGNVIITDGAEESKTPFDVISNGNDTLLWDRIGASVVQRGATGNSAIVTFSTAASGRDASLAADDGLIVRIVDGLIAGGAQITCQTVIIRDDLYDSNGGPTSLVATQPRVSLGPTTFIEVKSSGDVVKEWNQASNNRSKGANDTFVDTLVVLLQVTRGTSIATVGIISSPHQTDEATNPINELLTLVDKAGAGERDEKAFESSSLTQVVFGSMSYLNGVTPPYVATIAYLSPLSSQTPTCRALVTRMSSVPRTTAGSLPVTAVAATRPSSVATGKVSAKPKTGAPPARPKTAVTRGSSGTSTTATSTSGSGSTQTPRKAAVPLERPKTAAKKAITASVPAKVATKPAATTKDHTTAISGDSKTSAESKKVAASGSASSRIAAKKKAYATLPAGFSPNRTTGAPTKPMDAPALNATRSRPTATGSPAKAAATVRIRAESPPARTPNAAATPGKGAVPPRRGSAFQARPKSATGNAGGSQPVALRPDLTSVVALRPWNDSTPNEQDFATSSASGVINTPSENKSYRFDHVIQWEEKAVAGAPTTRFLRDAVVSGKDVLVISYGASPFFPRLSNGAYASLPVCWADDIFAAESKLDTKISVVELSQNKIGDMLAKTPTPSSLKIRRRDGIVVEGLISEEPKTHDDFQRLLNEAESRRRVVNGIPLTHIAYNFAITKDDRTVKVTYLELALSDKTAKKELTGADLKAHTDAVQSVATLNHCLSRSRGFRDSQLTSVLEDQLSGGAQVVLVASVARSERDITDTKATLTSISALKPIKAPAAARAAAAEAAAAAAEAKTVPAAASAPAPTSGPAVVRRGAVSTNATPAAAATPASISVSAVPSTGVDGPPVVSSDIDASDATAAATPAATPVEETKAAESPAPVSEAASSTTTSTAAVTGVADEVQAASDDDRNALMTYLSQPETTLLANTEIHATLGDVDAIIFSAGGIQSAIEILTTLDGSGRKFMGLDAIAPAVREFIAARQ